MTKLIITYLYYIVPFRELLDPVSFPKNPYLFSEGESGHWTVADQTAALEKLSRTHLDFRFNTERWRQIQTNLDAYFIHSGIDGNDEADEMDLIEDLQAAHSTKMAKTHYGRTAAGLDVRTRRDFRSNSSLWHNWFQLRSRRPESDYEDFTANEEIPTINVDETVGNAMQQLYAREWTWKHPKQKDAVEAIVRGDPHVVSVLPTDAGKTTLILVPALIDPHITQIVITPYVELANDLKRKCEGLYIDSIKWSPGVRVRASIVVIVVDTAISQEFIQYLRDLSLQSKLGRIFMDEAHVYLTETSWRWGITKIFDLSLPTSFAFITATLPPSMEAEFNRKMSLDRLDPTYIRGSCIRKEISYSVEKVPDDMELEERAIQIIENEEQSLHEGEKILIFSPDINQLKYIKAGLNCGLYTAKYDGKEQDLEAWRQGKFSTMCATSALGAGIDIPGIVLVIHVGFMFDVFTFQQGSGRGGRGGKSARSLTLINDGWFESTRRTDSRTKNMPVHALESYLQAETCRQQPLSAYFDGNDDDTITCTILNANPCDLCQRRAQENILQQPRQRVISKRPSTIDNAEQSKRQKIAQREEVIQERIRVDAVLEASVREMVEKLQTRCYICWVQLGSLDKHMPDECPFDLIYGVAPELTRERMEFPENHACFKCGLPCDWCKEYLAGGAQQCIRSNVIYAVAEQALQLDEWSATYKEWTQGRTLGRKRDRDKWLREPRLVFEKKSTNAFFVFTEVCRKRL